MKARWVVLASLAVGCGGDSVGLGGQELADAGAGGSATDGSGGASADDSGASGSGSADASTSTGGAPDTLKTSTKLDLLFVVDNSSSMSDKQEVLSRAVPDLIEQLTAAGSGVKDLHVGVITSSLGGHGSTSLCVGGDGQGVDVEEDDDHGWLVGTRPRASSVGAPSGFVSWTESQPTTDLTTKVQGLVKAAGEYGCGYEATLEAAYRFLADPAPYQSIVAQPCAAGSNNLCAFPQGIDATLLAQRAAFLRPDSAVAVVVLSDENDCSIRDSAQYYYAARTEIGLPPGSSQCITNPNDPCCYTCDGQAPAGCADGCNPTPVRDLADLRSLRCFQQKERFGLDFLYPVHRYVNALKSAWICPSQADLDVADCPDGDSIGGPDVVPNPLFQNAAGKPRDPSMVYMVGIVGVPFQDLATSTTDTELHYGPASSATWTTVLGDPTPPNAAPPISPADMHMVEATQPRAGIPGPSSGFLADPVNGHDWGNTKGDDLMYACIFPLDAARDCSQLINLPDPKPKCDCEEVRDGDDNPLCQASNGSYGTTQYFAKAYPGLRHLSVLEGLGPQGVAASICARNLTDPTKQDYGFRPAVEALVAAIQRSTP